MRNYKTPLAKRHYELIAGIIAKIPHDGKCLVRGDIALLFGRELKGTNPLFDYDRFIRAAQPDRED